MYCRSIGQRHVGRNIDADSPAVQRRVAYQRISGYSTVKQSITSRTSLTQLSRRPVRQLRAVLTTKFAASVLLEMPNTGSTAPVPNLQLEAYPYINMSTPGIELIHVEPPVFLVHQFLADLECNRLIEAAAAGSFKEASYRDAVLLDSSRLWPLPFVVVAGCVPTVMHALADGLTTLQVVQQTLTAFSAWNLIVLGLIVGVRSAVERNIQGKVFTGSKWTVHDLEAGSHAYKAYQKFCTRVASLLETPLSHLELPTITRYRTGEYQRVHTDARPLGDSEGTEEFMKAGGQRLVQCVVYLNDMSKEQGGATAFHHPTLGKLSVQPRKGMALVFFPAFRDGTVDNRMAHSGQVVKEGEKWIINTWAMQFEQPGATVSAPEYYYSS